MDLGGRMIRLEVGAKATDLLGCLARRVRFGGGGCCCGQLLLDTVRARC